MLTVGITEAPAIHACTPGYAIKEYDAPLYPNGPVKTFVRKDWGHHAIGSVYECDECGKLWRCVANQILAHGFCELHDDWRPMGRLASRRFRKHS